MFNGKTRWGYLCIESKINLIHHNNIAMHYWTLLFYSHFPLSAILLNNIR